MGGHDDDDFSAFAASQAQTLMRSAYLLTGRRADAEDAVQATLLKVYLAWPRIRRREAAGAYAQTTLVREVLSVRRGPLRRLWLTPTPPDMTIVTSPDAAETRDVVHQALLALPVQQRAVIVLRYFNDLTEQQTADVLGVRIGTVKQHASRGLARLRQTLRVSEEEST
jgi:RNA polymerase sigma-70 factor (sigma-E family)